MSAPSLRHPSAEAAQRCGSGASMRSQASMPNLAWSRPNDLSCSRKRPSACSARASGIMIGIHPSPSRAARVRTASDEPPTRWNRTLHRRRDNAHVPEIVKPAGEAHKSCARGDEAPQLVRLGARRASSRPHRVLRTRHDSSQAQCLAAAVRRSERQPRPPAFGNQSGLSLRRD